MAILPCCRKSVHPVLAINSQLRQNWHTRCMQPPPCNASLCYQSNSWEHQGLSFRSLWPRYKGRGKVGRSAQGQGGRLRGSKPRQMRRAPRRRKKEQPRPGPGNALHVLADIKLKLHWTARQSVHGGPCGPVVTTLVPEVPALLCERHGRKSGNIHLLVRPPFVCRPTVFRFAAVEEHAPRLMSVLLYRGIRRKTASFLCHAPALACGSGQPGGKGKACECHPLARSRGVLRPHRA
mmetsp:Transcript_117470/g.292873  ORF Transcript_117470/g.292873 Transcript_117470/m.292873 type:complete len:236 (+) Transcript_117470:217-924(+)